jgi:hypothetical protein
MTGGLLLRSRNRQIEGAGIVRREMEKTYRDTEPTAGNQELIQTGRCQLDEGAGGAFMPTSIDV